MLHVLSQLGQIDALLLGCRNLQRCVFVCVCVGFVRGVVMIFER